MAFLDLLFPKQCVTCGKFGLYICSDCRKKVIFFSSQICPICQHPSIGGVTHLKCQTRYSLDGLVSPMQFAGPIRSAIHKLKYKLISDLAKELVELLLSNKELVEVLKAMGRIGFILIPVPLHPKREKWRGFNQAEVLAGVISKKNQISFSPDILKRTKDTQPQAELKREARLKNVAGAFEVSNKKKVLGKKFLLFDDTTTTCATLRFCALALKKAGASSVWALTLTRSAK